MEIQDRSPILEELLFQLWERGYFDTLELKTPDRQPVQIISQGIRNNDSGPDFKNITIRVNETIHQGDLEIHRAANDWYLHHHHHDPAYNNVILHLVIGNILKTDKKPVRLNQSPVPVEVFIDIPEKQFQYLTKKYQLSIEGQSVKKICKRRLLPRSQKSSLIEAAGVLRLNLKADRFSEQRSIQSWNQILYAGMMEALGYSKNQRPFRKLALLLPIEAIIRELQTVTHSATSLQALLFGAAGLLPQQDPRLVIKDREAAEFIEQLELSWLDIRSRIGIEPMRREEWQFFRLRPVNFPTRRLAGACDILSRLIDKDFFAYFLSLLEGIQNRPYQIISEFENAFICPANDFWGKHFMLSEGIQSARNLPLVGKNRARDIVVNILLPLCYAYSKETENGRLKSTIMQIYRQYPKLASNSIIREMSDNIIDIPSRQINTALKQQGLIHLYKMYCQKKECHRCTAAFK